jgi:hypothetical protein
VLHPHGNILAKSGTDFRDLTRLDITLPPAAAAAAGAAAGAAAAASSSGPTTITTNEQQPAAATTTNATPTHAASAGANSSSSSSSRLHFTWRHITPDIGDEDAETAKVRWRWGSLLLSGAVCGCWSN